MTRLVDDPATFSDDMLKGFVDAYQQYVVAVPGGVVRATQTTPGKVAVVVGGGSGHYPAFCGIVGPGFADGAVVGNVFTSPSTADAVSVGRAVDSGGGVVFSTGNYAGDVMNFNQAVDQLRQEGIEARYVLVTDDVASAPANERAKRRGIAGDFTVFKVASAAAEAGYDLEGVQRVAERANGATRTLGVAFDGCTMPGAKEPLFTVEPGHMGLGLGIHGEPGIEDRPLPSASELARLLVDGVLADAPEGAGDRVTVILNGLGRTKYEELFVVWGTVSSLLREAGLTVVEPEVGELVTSLDMAGCSLTVMWLDEELEGLWHAPAATPAYTKGIVAPADAGQRRQSVDVAATEAGPVAEQADKDGLAVAAVVRTGLERMAGAMAQMEEELGRIDAVAGDGDHGRGMVRGTSAALAAANATHGDHAGPSTVLTAAGDAWAARAGGTSGVLWGAALKAVGNVLSNTGRPSPEQVAEAVRNGYDALVRLGGAQPGDKTMLDALLPFCEELSAATGRGDALSAAWDAASTTARAAAEATAQLRPKVGRARPLAERSLGTPDAGALSLAVCVAAVGEVLRERAQDSDSAAQGPQEGTR
ncbi:MAG TPA: dihydroxyacetone kinase family protein [Segeticoccus sp.]|uniref:dihydroxyacetone kinase family protein n=1 Tax=Segeticoccus sp. TaxID=2706531 RepID=UPI002D80ABD9|nr:dihydroxyacetone kinase family protein [Segeticoccus sp.]HET8599820.1 dihydroxyacetone kinase family protein [Segeticoccus sp.]